MTKLFCDRCRDEIKSDGQISILIAQRVNNTLLNARTANRDLCKRCYSFLVETLTETLAQAEPK